jgi:hypothetical protein
LLVLAFSESTNRIVHTVYKNIMDVRIGLNLVKVKGKNMPVTGHGGL